MTREEGKAFANALKNNYTIDFDKLPEFCDLVISALEKNESAEEWYKLLCEKWDSAENKGEWRPIYQGDEIIDYRCTNCEFGSTFGKGTYNMHFCPNCGADMRGGEE